MKTFFLILMLISIEASSNELTWVDEQIQAIIPQRDGVDSKNIQRLHNPFIFLNKNIKVLGSKTTTSYSTSSSNVTKKSFKTKKTSSKNTYFKLNAIMNKFAFINSKWYKKDEKVKGYTIANIGTTDVLSLIHI